MYESFFQLRHRPFAAAPSSQRYIPIASVEQARQSLVRCIERAEGPGLVVGPSGIGKTILCQVLARHFEGKLQIAQLSGGRVGTRRALLQNILFELRLPYRDMDEGELRLSLIDHLSPREADSKGMLLIVDEAHLLPLRLLDEIRLLTNLVHNGQSLVNLVLAGGPAMEERLTSPKLDSLQQRIAARCYLQPLNRQETHDYIRQQIEQAGGDAQRIFQADAMQAVYSASDGIPRLINQVCDHALVLARLGGVQQISLQVIQEAWSDLQQLPTPWHEVAKSAMSTVVESGGSAGDGHADIIEFGALDEPAEAQPRLAKPHLAEATVQHAAEVQLEQLDRNVTALSDDFGDLSSSFEPAIQFSRPGDFNPLDESATEVELFFPASADPFGGNWEEEEIVIDRYASLEAQAVSNRPRVASKEGRQINSALAAIDADKPRARSSRLRSVESIETVAPPRQVTFDLEPEILPPASAGGLGDFGSLMNSFSLDPANDPVMPETELPETSPPLAPISLRDFADDRDIIVIEDSSATPLRGLVSRETKKQDYRRLFSSLRNR